MVAEVSSWHCASKTSSTNFCVQQPNGDCLIQAYQLSSLYEVRLIVACHWFINKNVCSDKSADKKCITR